MAVMKLIDVLEPTSSFKKNKVVFCLHGLFKQVQAFIAKEITETLLASLWGASFAVASLIAMWATRQFASISLRVS